MDRGRDLVWVQVRISMYDLSPEAQGKAFEMLLGVHDVEYAEAILTYMWDAPRDILERAAGQLFEELNNRRQGFDFRSIKSSEALTAMGRYVLEHLEHISKVTPEMLQKMDSETGEALFQQLSGSERDNSQRFFSSYASLVLQGKIENFSSEAARRAVFEKIVREYPSSCYNLFKSVQELSGMVPYDDLLCDLLEALASGQAGSDCVIFMLTLDDLPLPVQKIAMDTNQRGWKGNEDVHMALNAILPRWVASGYLRPFFRQGHLPYFDTRPQWKLIDPMKSREGMHEALIGCRDYNKDLTNLGRGKMVRVLLLKDEILYDQGYAVQVPSHVHSLQEAKEWAFVEYHKNSQSM